MKELTLLKKHKIYSLLKKYSKKYLTGKYSNLDESATRLMVNEFLFAILGFISLDEIKTEYMIKGTYADYVVQIKGKRYFIVEVKAMPIELSEKHLRQTVNYAANEGIEWALLTNGKCFEFYKILFNKPIESRQVFSFDLSNKIQLKQAVECFQYLVKELLLHRGLDNLWQRVSALDPVNLSKLFYSKPILNYLRRQLRRSYRNNFSIDDISTAVARIIVERVEIPQATHKHKRKKRHMNLSKKYESTELMSSVENSQVALNG